MESVELILKEDFSLDGFYLFPKGTKKTINGIRYGETNEYQIYISEIGLYTWIDESKCDLVI